MSDLQQRKARGDAKLKSLPEERQAQIVEHLVTHKLHETLAWLGKDGVKTSSAALSEFLSWYRLRERLDRNESTVEQALERWKLKRPGMSEEDLFALGQEFFSVLAIDQQDSLSWKRAQDALAKLKAVKVMERRVALLEQKAAQAEEAEKVTGDNTLTDTQKQARMREIFGLG